MTPPVRFVFGLHLHQPSGNFDHVFQEHVDHVYRPTLSFLEERGLVPFALHVSGPLLEWLEIHDRPLHDRIGRLVSDGEVELLTAGFYEPILIALDPVDRAEQLQWMSDYLRSRFGVEGRSAWLTERVFESELVGDLAEAGVENLLVDDWHVLAGGVPQSRLHGLFRTEGRGREITLVPIHERLRYLVPFQPAAEVDAYFRTLASEGAPLAVLADDGEKFGGWPGTRKRVWDEGWFDRFAQALIGLRDEGVLRFTTIETAVIELDATSLVYPPSASYREMGEWALLPTLVDSDHPFPGSPWRNFFLRYAESNALHKKARILSRLCRRRGDPAEARRAIGRAQCNDPYWHGVFGGIYMKHLRDAAWRQLALAEAILREGEGLEVEELDLDLDGEAELWVHSDAFSAQVGVRSGRVKELTWFDQGANLADVLTRRREAYHEPAVARGLARASGGNRKGRVSGDHGPDAHDAGNQNPGEDSPSIHDLEDSYVLDEMPAVDREPRSLLAARVVSPHVDEEAWAAGDAPVHWSDHVGADSRDGQITLDRQEQRVVLSRASAGLETRLIFSSKGRVEARYRWDPGSFPGGSLFTVEVSLAAAADVVAHPQGLTWRYPVVTVPRSERGFERITQGESVTVVWPVEQGEGAVTIARSGPGA